MTTSTRLAISSALSFTLLFGACSTHAGLLSPYSDPNAPLAGKLWDIRNQRFVEAESVLDAAPAGSWLLLGETHENLDHHEIETLFVEYLASQSRMGALALEMANLEQQDLLDQAQRGTLEITPENLNWQKGWPWEWYKAPVTAGLEQASRVVATDLTRDAKMDAYRDSELEVPASEAYKEFMLDLLYESHCGQMPKSQLGSMLRVQYARDKNMRETLLANTHSDKPNLMLAGTVHTRYDIGIPYWSKELKSKTLLMIAATDNTDPSAYYPDSYSTDAVADYILFTPPTEYESGCK